jgi:hypothetical protein
MIHVIDSGLEQAKLDKWQVEPLYGAVYHQKDISDEQIEQWEKEINSELHVPELNE